MDGQKTQAVQNPVAALRDYGQSVWLDYIRRSLITGGELKRLVDEDGLGGVTSNPAIFEKAIGGSNDYASAIDEISIEPGLRSKEVFEILAVKDIQDAADVLRTVYDRTHGQDGFVSLEVAPDLANDTEGTQFEARRLWGRVARPNVMIKVPATPAGLPAIRTLLSEGININITLLFARDAYEKVAHAYLDALDARAGRGQDVSRVASVASFFVSRIDSAVDAQLEEKMKTATGQDKARMLRLLGKVAIANAKVAYQSYKQIFSGPRWEALAKKGAHVQRVLWASTGTKDPALPDTFYIHALAAAKTINTMPEETLKAFAAHGIVDDLLEADGGDVDDTIAAIEAAGVSVKELAAQLQVEGAKSFVDSWTDLLQCVESKTATVTAH